MQAPAAVTAAMVIIGNEILSGRTQDANLNYLAKFLDGLGIRLREVRVVPDDEAAIIETVNHVRSRYDYVFTTGGIGSTHDDITAASIAKAFGVALIRHPEAEARLRAHYAGTDMLNEARLRMANTPDGATLIDNPVSSAPGFRIGNVLVMAGVPVIMQAMLSSLRHQLTGGPKLHTHVVTSGIPEGSMADQLATIQDRFPQVEIGSYPGFRGGKILTALVLRGVDLAQLEQATRHVADLIVQLGATPTIETDSVPPAA